VGTQVANRDITISNVAVVPNKINARGQTLLTVHSIAGGLYGTLSNVRGAIQGR